MLYRNAPKELDDLFTQYSANQQNQRSSDGSEQNLTTKSDGPTVLVKGMQSFKVLTECPLVIMLLFQIYPFKYMEKNGPILLPAMLHVLMLNPPLPITSTADGGDAAQASLTIQWPQQCARGFQWTSGWEYRRVFRDESVAQVPQRVCRHPEGAPGRYSSHTGYRLQTGIGGVYSSVCGRRIFVGLL